MAGTLTGFLGALGGGDNYFSRLSERLHPEIAQQRNMGELRREELELRRVGRSQDIEQQKRFRNALQNPEVLGLLSERFGVPQELIGGIGNISELSALGRVTAPQGGATGELVRQVMSDNPGMSYTSALQLVQTGFRQNLTFDPTTGGLVPLRGAPAALGELARGEKFGGQLGTLQARETLEPAVAEAVAAAKVRGAGEITEVERREIDLAESKIAADTALEASISEAGNINSVIDKAINQAGAWTTGLGSTLRVVPGTAAADLEANLKTIQADAAFSSLQQMRDRSKTGGALGQVSERELALLGAARAALEGSQSTKQFKENLRRYKKVREQSLINSKAAYKREFGVEFKSERPKAPKEQVISPDDLARLQRLRAKYGNR